MGLISSIEAFAGVIAAGVVVKILADDAKEWSPTITKWLVRRAVRRLPTEWHERYQEEWTSHLDELPGTLAKIFFGANIHFAAQRIQKRCLEASNRALVLELIKAALSAQYDYVLNEMRARGIDYKKLGVPEFCEAMTIIMTEQRLAKLPEQRANLVRICLLGLGLMACEAANVALAIGVELLNPALCRLIDPHHLLPIIVAGYSLVRIGRQCDTLRRAIRLYADSKLFSRQRQVTLPYLTIPRGPLD